VFDDNFNSLLDYFVGERIEHIITREKTYQQEEANKRIIEILENLKKYAPENFSEDVERLEDNFAIIESNNAEDIYRMAFKDGAKSVMSLLQK